MGNTVTLHSACEYGDLAEVHRLLKTATAEELEATDDSGRTPLLLAVASLKHLREHQELLDDFDDLHGFGDSDEETEIITQTHEQNVAESSNSETEETVNEVRDDADLELMPKEAEILHLLLQRRVNVDHTDENGWTALHHACFVQNAMAIKMLIHAGAKPMRESYGLLPQDLLQRGHMSEWVAQAQELKEALDQITDKSAYAIKLLAFRPSGIVQLDMGGQVEKGSLVTLEYDVPERHSVKDYIQVLISEEDSAEIETGSYHYVPAGAHGQLTISTKDIPPASTVRFVYVKSDINTMSREVVASGCNAVVQASVGEIFQYELFLYERVVEVESIPEFEFIDQPLIVLKRIGIVVGEDIDWVTIRPDNHIVAVNDIRIDAMDFAEAVHVLQENNGRQCTKLLMQNYSACGDFIPEKILGVGVVGKYAYLHPVDEDQDGEGDEQTYEEWVRNSQSENGDSNGESAIHEESARWLHEPSATFDSAKLNGNIATASEDSSPTPRRASKRASERRKRSTSAARAATAAKASASTSSSPAEAADKDEGKKRPLMTSFKDGKPWITVMGLGGAGSNAVNNMIASQLEGVEFIVANTDCQALGRSLAPHKITLGKDITKGLGAGSKPELGKRSAEQQKEDIQQMLQDSNMLFITGGMGGGTCTGAAPVVASVARELGILTVGVVSTPFRSEGPNRTRLASAGVKELAKYVDTLIVVPNQNLLALADKSTTMLEAFRYADDVLLEGVKGVTDLIVRPGLINLDFADIKTILSNAGRAIMGSGISSEEGRARKAAEQALVNPLLGDLPTESAHGLLVTIRGGEDMTLFEVDEIMEIIRSRVHDEANIIFGTCYDQSLEGSVYVSIIVSGIQTDVISPPIGGAHVPLQETHKRAETGEFVVKPSPDDEKPAEQRKGLFGRFFSL
ncbi:hypothetical protein JG688_00001850 [Phytophthora aleatoria]|uniref:Cell division protein FtsZ n=1 Tax=Phytophthora aleatoria TaxID=2496075 RepID=A0A8J5MI15_9STRA|nr:hypothetical protein JG688_00001850 [Phytophthora aleatoria]